MIGGGTAGRLTLPKRMTPSAKTQVAACGPFVGMRDSLDPSVSNDPKYALDLQNLVPLELDKPTTFSGRPGFSQAGSQLGAVGKRTGQLVYQFTKLDGTEYTVAIVGGQGIYTYNWGTSTWTLVVTVANLTTAGITLSETARIYAETYTDNLWINDGANTSFLWNGTTGASGLLRLVNAPVIYGQQRIHYAKGFAIKNAARNVEVWSEENDATLGYETAPYSNSWQLGQTDQESLYANAPTNEALYYFRARSIGKILGAVTPDFTADGTHEGVSQSVGTISPDGVCVVGERVFFIDADARPHVIEGGQVVPLFDNIRETIRGLDKTKLANFSTRYDPLTGLVLFAVVENGQTNPSAILAYNPVLNVPVSVWRGFTFTAVGIVKNASGVPVLMHLSDDGYAYVHGTLTGSAWNDAFNAGTIAIAHAVETCHLATDTEVEKRFARADLLLRAETDTTSISVRMVTPYGANTAQTGSVTSSESRWDEFNWDQDTWASGVVERHLAVGFNQTGRWARVRLEHQMTGEQFGFTKLTVNSTTAGIAPQAA